MPLLGMVPKEINLQLSNNVCTKVIIAALLIRVQNWNNLNVHQWGAGLIKFNKSTAAPPENGDGAMRCKLRAVAMRGR